MKTILLLGGNKDARLIAEIASDMGLHVIVVDRNPDCEARTVANVFLEASCYHIEEVLAAIWGFDIDAVLCAGVDAPHVAAAVAEEYNLVGPTKTTANNSIDKIKQRTLFEQYNLNKPTWKHINIPEWRVENPFIENWQGGIMVVKPADSRGARGVIRLLPGDSWVEARNISRKSSPTGRTLFEKWTDGTQLSSESIVQNGQILWTAFSERNYDKLERFKPYVIEDGGDMPPKLPVVHEYDYSEIAHTQLQRCVDALELKTGTIKGDLVWNNGKIYVIEVAVRLSGGGFCTEQIPLCWGVPFVQLAIQLALGERIEWPDRFDANRDWPKLYNHVCQRYEFPEGVKSHPERGDYVIGVGDSRKEARDKARELLK